MVEITQSNGFNDLFFAHDGNGDPVTGIADGSFTKRISKNGGAFADMTVTVVELENGWYQLPLTAAHTDTAGALSITLTASGMKQVNLQYKIVTAASSATVVVGAGSTLAGSALISRTDLDNVWGVNNIDTWAALNADDDATDISDRVTQAITWASAEINNRFRSSKYTTPLSFNNDSAAFLTIVATFAGWWLYASRGVNATDEGDEVTRRFEMAEMRVRDILAGKINLDAAKKWSAPSAPVAVM